MTAEDRIVDYIRDTRFNQLSTAALVTVKNMLLADIGTTIGGAHAEGCMEIVDYYRSQGGVAEASLLVHGGLVPAQNAACANAIMSRALDFCDAIAPGAHIGSSIIPVALACAELRGGCDGREFITALVIGAEIGARFNLSESAYDGFDPTGICVPFAATAVASRLLGLSERQTLNALGIVFNRCGGSFQSNIDGTLSVRANQGWVAQDAIASVRLALLGFSGPQNFLDGLYGYLHLYGKNEYTSADIVDGLGREDRLLNMVFKKYPSCGMTQGPTEAIISILHQYQLAPTDIVSITLTLPPYGHRLVGHKFKTGSNPTVDAQFSAQYCIANVLLREGVSIRHFTPDFVCDAAINKYLSMIKVDADAELDQRGHTAMEMEVRSRSGDVYKQRLDVAPGFPGNPLTEEDYKRRFEDCLEFDARTDSARADEIVTFIRNIESATEVCELISLITQTINQA